MDLWEISRQKDVPAAFWMFVLDLRQRYGMEAEDMAKDIWEKGDEKGEEVKIFYKSLRLHLKHVRNLTNFNWSFEFQQADKLISFNYST